MTLSATSIRNALEGVVIASSCGPDGAASVQLFGGCHYLDDDHVAMGYLVDYQVRLDGLRSGFCRLLAFDPRTARKYNVLMQHVRTESSGPIAEFLRLRLAGVTSHQSVPNLVPLGYVDVYRVLRIDSLPGFAAEVPQQPDILPALRRASGAVAAAADVESLVDVLLDELGRSFAIRHAMVLMREGRSTRFVTVDSRGYEAHGSGAEVSEGEGVIGAAAYLGVPMRIDNALIAHARARVIIEKSHPDLFWSSTQVPLPGLAQPGSQMAVPIVGSRGAVGVLYCEDEATYRFDANLEHALAVLANLFATALDRLEGQASVETPADARDAEVRSEAPSGEPLHVWCERRTNAVFVNGDYIIRGVAGAVLRRMLECHTSTGQTEFTNRLLRHDPELVLPDLDDNLSARLIILQRRLEQRPCGIRLRKAGRGRLALEIDRPLKFESDAMH